MTYYYFQRTKNQVHNYCKFIVQKYIRNCNLTITIEKTINTTFDLPVQHQNKECTNCDPLIETQKAVIHYMASLISFQSYVAVTFFTVTPQ